MGLLHRQRTGEGQWVDLACIEAAGTLNGVATLDATVNQRPMRRPGMPNSNRSHSPQMTPHGIWQTRGEDEWVAIAVRNDDDWKAMSEVIGEPWSTEKRWEQIEVRLRDESELEQRLAEWAITHNRREIAERLVDAGVPAAPVLKPQERIEFDQRTIDLWVTVDHTEIGRSRVEGLPVSLSETPWSVTRGAACLGEHNGYVFGELLGLSEQEIMSLAEEGVI